MKANLFCCCLLVSTAFGYISTTETEIPNLVRCLVHIIENVKTIKKMAIFSDSEIPMDGLVKIIGMPFTINTEESTVKEGIDLREMNDLVIVLNKNITVTHLLKTTLWNAHTLFLLVYDGNWSPEIFQDFWEEKMNNVFALVLDESDVMLYTFVPYGVNNCDVVNSVLIDRCNNGKFISDGLEMMQNDAKILNMNKCPVNVTIVDVKPQVFFHDDCACNGSYRISGIEGNIMKEIAIKFNMEVMYVIARDGIGWGWIKPTPKGVVGEVYTGRSDFGMGLLAPTIERFENLDLSVQYDGHECITYGVPKGAGAKQPTWIMILIFEFEGIMWLLIGLVFIIILFQLQIINKTLKMSLFPDKFDSFMYLFGSCLGIPVKLQLSVTLRLAVISWILFTFIITVAYRSSMGSKLTVPTPDPDIDNFKELLQSDLKLTGYNNMLRLMQYNDSEPEIKLMADRFEVTNFDIDDAVYDIAIQRDIAHVRHTSTFLYYSLINAEARGHIHLLKDCIYRYYPIFVMKKNSPFRKRANHIILSLYESGIIQYWKSWYIYELPKKPNTFQKLSLEHTFGMFFIIFMGYALAFLLFVGELVYHRLTTKKIIKMTSSAVVQQNVCDYNTV